MKIEKWRQVFGVCEEMTWNAELYSACSRATTVCVRCTLPVIEQELSDWRTHAEHNSAIHVFCKLL